MSRLLCAEELCVVVVDAYPLPLGDVVLTIALRHAPLAACLGE
jgi:hypothetical protein